jgi:outer membrane protein TolC
MICTLAALTIGLLCGTDAAAQVQLRSEPAAPSALSAAPAAPSGADAPEPPLSLPQAIDEALARSPTQRAARATSVGRGWQQQLAWASMLPRLDVFAAHTLTYRFATEATGATPTEGVVALKSPLTELGLAMFYPAFDGLQNVRRIRASALHRQAAESEEAWAAFVLQRQVRLVYRRVQAAGAWLAAAVQQVAALEAHRDQVASMRGQGAATDFDLLRVQVQLQDAQTAQLRGEDTIAVGRRDLARLMGRARDPRPLQGGLPVPSAADVAAVRALDVMALPERQDLQALERTAAAHAQLRAAASGFWLPKLDVVGTLGTYNNWDRSITDPSLFNAQWNVGVRVRMNLFDGLAAAAEARVQQAAGEAVRQRLQAARLSQGLALEEHQRGYLYADAQHRARALNTERAERNLELARSGFANGSRNSTDVLDAQTDLFNARAGAIEALLALEQGAVQLELALGRELEHHG